MQGIVIKAISGFYYVNCENTVYECKARGNFRKAEVSPLVGDKVEISLTDSTHGVLERIFERKNSFKRPLIANIDKLFIVSAYSTPEPDLLMIDRLTALCVFRHVEPIIIFNKSDMGNFDYYFSVYNNAGFKTYVVSAKDNSGIDALKNEIRDCVSAFTGNTGVGKSSILNMLIDGAQLETGEVSTKLGRGRHTTRHTELLSVDGGGFVADTPGFSSLDSDMEIYEFKQNLPQTFPDFSDYVSVCRFTSCTHTKENGCGVIKAVDEGKIEKTRHESYIKIFEELKPLKEWNMVNKK